MSFPPITFAPRHGKNLQDGLVRLSTGTCKDIKVEIMSSKPTPKQYKIIGSLSEIQDFLLYIVGLVGGCRISTQITLCAWCLSRSVPNLQERVKM